MTKYFFIKTTGKTLRELSLLETTVTAIVDGQILEKHKGYGARVYVASDLTQEKLDMLNLYDKNGIKVYQDEIPGSSMAKWSALIREAGKNWNKRLKNGSSQKTIF